MTPIEPHWTVYVQAFGTPLIALIAGGIASGISYRQWQTAKEKVVLDLFEKRLAAYNLISDAIFKLEQVSSDNIDHEIIGPFAVGMKQSKFIFGQEVNLYLDRIFWVIHHLRRNARRQREEFTDGIEKLLEEQDKMEAEISRFREKFDFIVDPYMRMDAKLANPFALRRLLPSRFRKGRKT